MMSAMTSHHMTLDFNERFDPEHYIATYVDNRPDLINPAGKCLVYFSLKQLHKYFSSGTIRGKRVLEIGTGVTIHTIISACANEHVKEIVLSDIAVKCRNLLSDWLDRKRDLDQMSFKYLQSHNYLTESPKDFQNKMRDKVNYVAHIDITKEMPFGVPIQPEYDIVISKLCLDSACHSTDEYKTCASRMAAFLKLGGYLILIGVFGASYYEVGDYKFSSCTVTKEFVRRTFEDLNFELIEFDYEAREKPYDCNNCDFQGTFAMLARKKPI